MTGYAQAVAEQDGFTLTVSLRSVNHRFLDLHVHLPEQLLSLEAKVRREIKERKPSRTPGIKGYTRAGGRDEPGRG